MEIQLCIDCVYADANGPDPEMHADWPGFLPEWHGWGFISKVERFGDEYEIAEPHFEKSACHGCGSGLAGDRWDYVAWMIRKDAS